MLKEAIAMGETVEIAFEKACRELGVNCTEAKQEILEAPVKKTFGLFGGSPAKVRAYIEISPATRATAYVKEILAGMGLENLSIDVQDGPEDIAINLAGDDIGFIIGHRGDTLDALQYLASLVANQGEEKYRRVTLDVGSFRAKRRETLETLGRKMAIRAVKIGRNNALEPMNPYERRIIHTAVQTVEGAKSWSEGEDMGRHVVVGPIEGEKARYNNSTTTNNRPQRDMHRGGRDHNRNARGGRPAQPQQPQISETAPQPFSPVPLDVPAPERKKAEDAPLYGRIHY